MVTVPSVEKADFGGLKTSVRLQDVSCHILTLQSRMKYRKRRHVQLQSIAQGPSEVPHEILTSLPCCFTAYLYDVPAVSTSDRFSPRCKYIVAVV